MTDSHPYTEPIVELRGATKAFGKNVILDQVDLTIHRGESIALIGPSGTGKSSILRMIAGLLPLDEGEIYIKGKKKLGLVGDGNCNLSVSLVFQQTALFDSLSVAENVGFSLYENSRLPHAKIADLVEEKLGMVGLPGTGHLYPSELSGGMRKRVSFARAIMTDPERPQDNPELLLYDEPTAGLDPIASTVIEDLVVELHRLEGASSTFVIVSHQDTTIRRTAHRVVFMYGGKIQWQGPMSELDTTDNPFVRQFCSASTAGPIRVID